MAARLRLSTSDYGQTDSGIVVAIDADTVFADNSIELLVRHFADPSIGAVAGTAVVGNQVTVMARFQALEYVTVENLDRRAFERFNAIGVVPGAIGAWRREALLQAGGYSHDTLAEDADITVAIERRGWRVLYEPRAVAFTEAPERLGAFLKQRFRWMFGTLQVAFKHAGALAAKPQGVALITLPNILVFQFAFTLLAPLMDAVLLLNLLLGLREWLASSAFPDNLSMVARYWLLFQTVDDAIRRGRDGARRPARLLALVAPRFPPTVLLSAAAVFRRHPHAVRGNQRSFRRLGQVAANGERHAGNLGEERFISVVPAVRSRKPCLQRFMSPAPVPLRPEWAATWRSG